MKNKILQILRSSESYVSGQELCECMEVSRTAIWKNIKKLQEEGYEIEAVPNRGYRLLSTPDCMTKEEIMAFFPLNEKPGYEVLYLKETDSTNSYAKKIAEAQEKKNTLIVTEIQTNGKGRRGRSWSSKEGESIAMSLLLFPDIEPKNASMLTLVMGLSVVEAIEELYQVKAQIKWPNDVVISGKKICGILTEMSAQMDYINYLVIGIGINVRGNDFSEEIKNIAGSLEQETGVVIKRAELIVKILECFERHYIEFQKTEDLSSMVAAYNKALISLNKEIKVLDPKREYQGISHGINEKGELLVEKEDHTQTVVYAGEVSVRGLYGYVR